MMYCGVIPRPGGKSPNARSSWTRMSFSRRSSPPFSRAGKPVLQPLARTRAGGCAREEGVVMAVHVEWRTRGEMDDAILVVDDVDHTVRQGLRADPEVLRDFL